MERLLMRNLLNLLGGCPSPASQLPVLPLNQLATSLQYQKPEQKGSATSRVKASHQVQMFQDHSVKESSLFCLELHFGSLTLNCLKLLENISCYSGFSSLPSM
ncbi:hypothetical protein HanPSC8_Chr02g0055961 [Helianthus annuus]|nr:hypothetical protein HanPSC8_Chr02g0055961 [Helianthus annuus]